MPAHIVRDIKKFHHIRVQNAVTWIGYRFKPLHRIPTNVDVMLEGMPRCDLLKILAHLKEWSTK